jgi:carboxymethylenebutenolidase
MCDQDHFEGDRLEFEARGLVTRKQFGMMLGAGVSITLPAVANAAPVTEAEVNITTPDGTADAYFVHPASGTGAGVVFWPDIFWVASGAEADGEAAGGIRYWCWW